MSESKRPFVPALPSILFLMMMVFFAIFPRLVFAPLLLSLSRGLGISFGRASNVFLSLSAGFVTGLLTSGFVSRKLSNHGTITFATALSGTVLVSLFFVDSLALLHSLLLVLGWATGLYPGSGIATVTAMVHEHDRGKALALHESGPNLAFILAPVSVSLLEPLVGWRGVLLFTGIAALLTSIVFFFRGSGKGRYGEPPHFENLKLFARNRSFWVLSILFTLGASATIGVFSVLPTFLVVGRGLQEQFVNTLVGISRITGFAALFAGGIMVDRLGFKKVLLIVFSFTGVLTVLLGIASGPVLILTVFLQPLIVGSFFPAALSELTRVSPPKAENLSVALAIPMANIFGSGLVPRLMGAAGEAGYFGVSFVVLGLLILASVGLLPLMDGR
jgi:predicted MFS family arabinose efflux permease